MNSQPPLTVDRTGQFSHLWCKIFAHNDHQLHYALANSPEQCGLCFGGGPVGLITTNNTPSLERKPDKHNLVAFTDFPLFSNCGLLSPSAPSYFYGIMYNTFSDHRQEAVEGASIIAKIPNFVKKIFSARFFIHGTGKYAAFVFTEAYPLYYAQF